MTPKPVIYLFYGDDEYTLSQQVKAFKERMGDPSIAEMNTTWLEGESTTLTTLSNASLTAPFLAERRVIVVQDFVSQLKNPEDQSQFLSFLQRIPQSSALILLEIQNLSPDHWLIQWGKKHHSRIFIRQYSIPKGYEFNRWIQNQAQMLGGEIKPDAAGLLASIVEEDVRMARQELDKLMAFVNYSRPIEVEDVNQLTSIVIQGNIFKLVDAVSTGRIKQATATLHQLLEEHDPLYIFGMIIRQFRLLLQAREVVDSGKDSPDVLLMLKIKPYESKKITQQVYSFDLKTLEKMYHSLLETDIAIKTGELEDGVALDLLITELTLSHPVTHS
ncbi:MAG: DNA polymerase III subunit delta [Chloroflexota bacterium]